MKEIIMRVWDKGEKDLEGYIKANKIEKIVRCINCGDRRQDGYCERWHIAVRDDFFCADGDDGNLQEET